MPFLSVLYEFGGRTVAELGVLLDIVISSSHGAKRKWDWGQYPYSPAWPAATPAQGLRWIWHLRCRQQKASTCCEHEEFASSQNVLSICHLLLCSLHILNVSLHRGWCISFILQIIQLKNFTIFWDKSLYIKNKGEMLTFMWRKAISMMEYGHH